MSQASAWETAAVFGMSINVTTAAKKSAGVDEMRKCGVESKTMRFCVEVLKKWICLVYSDIGHRGQFFCCGVSICSKTSDGNLVQV